MPPALIEPGVFGLLGGAKTPAGVQSAARPCVATLTDLEPVFRSLKPELDLRPIFHHHKPIRADGHLFASTGIVYQLVRVTLCGVTSIRPLRAAWYHGSEFEGAHSAERG